MAKEYKIPINKDMLTQLFFVDNDKITSEMLEELNKVINVVFIKHFSNYSNNEDLRQQALLAVFEHKPKYDPSFSAYNYIYSICRNEIGNKIKKYGKETFVDDLLPYQRGFSDISGDSLPPEVKRYFSYLAGMLPFRMVKVLKADVLPLILFLNLHDKQARPAKVPEFIEENPKSLGLMYRMLQNSINNIEQ